MNAGIYKRVSLDEQEIHGYSLADQERACVEKANEIGADNIKIYSDVESGSTLERPGLQQLRQDIANGLIDVLIIRDPDRLSRRLVHQLIITEEFEKAKVQLVFLDFEWKNTPEGRLYYSIRGSFSEYEREKIKLRTTRGKLQKARQGGIPQSFLNYGYNYDVEKNKVSINEEEANVVKDIFSWFTKEQLSPAAITNRLNHMAIPTKKNTGYWLRQTVNQILANSVYIGEWKYGRYDYISGKPLEREAIIVPVPAIVDHETWDQSQTLLKEIRRLSNNQGKHEYLLSGILTCSDCGQSMGGKYGKNWGRYERTYTCCKSKSTNRISGCRPAKQLNADKLEDIVWEKVKYILNNPDELREEIEKNLPDSDDIKIELTKIEKRLMEVIKGRNNLMETISLGLFELDDGTKAKLTDLKHQKEFLEKRKRELESYKPSTNYFLDIAATAKDLLDDLDSLDFSVKKSLIRSLVSQIMVSGRVLRGYRGKPKLPGVNITVIFKAEQISNKNVINFRHN